MTVPKILVATIETPDGVVIPGPHGVSSGSETHYPGISSMVALIASGGEGLLIDSGSRTAEGSPHGVLSKVCELIDSRPGLNLKYILQSHWHFDHVGNTEYLRSRYGAKVLCHPKERTILEDPVLGSRPEYVEALGGNLKEIEKDLNLVDYSMFPEASIRKYWNFPLTIDDEVEDGDILEVGEFRLQVVHTPGHTPGHLSLWNPSTKSLYLMDVSADAGLPIHPFPAGGIDEMVGSVRKCLALEPEYLYPGHELPRCPKDDAEDYLKDIIVRHIQIERRILVVLNRHGAFTIQELYPEVFVLKDRYDYAHNGWYTYSMACLHCHLRRLLDQGKIERLEKDDGKTAWGVTSSGKLTKEEIDPYWPDALETAALRPLRDVDWKYLHIDY